MPNEYKLEIVLSEQIKTQDTITEAQAPTTTPSKQMDSTEDNTKFLDSVKNSTAFKVGGSIVAAGVAVGKEIYDYKLTSAKSLGYDNKSLRMQEGMSIVTKGATLLAGVGLLATGNPLGLLAIGYTALDMAKQNRQNLINIQLDLIQSSKTQGRLIQNTTQRSR